MPWGTLRCLPFTSSTRKCLEKNIPFYFPRIVSTNAGNHAENEEIWKNWNKKRNTGNLFASGKAKIESRWLRYLYTYFPILTKHLPEILFILSSSFSCNSIPSSGCSAWKKTNKNIFPSTTKFNPNNLNIYSTTEHSFECLRNNTVSGFHIILRQWQNPNHNFISYYVSEKPLITVSNHITSAANP